MRVNVEPQLRGTARSARTDPSRQSGDGRSGRDHRPLRRRPRTGGGAGVKPFTRLTSVVAVLDRADVDTDQIMPKQFLKRIERTGFGEFLFYEWMKDPDFELRRPEYEGARVLVTGRNFGSGSSREHAPWGLQEYGFDVIV